MTTFKDLGDWIVPPVILSFLAYAHAQTSKCTTWTAQWLYSQIYIGRNLSQGSKVELSCQGKGSVSYGLGADFSLLQLPCPRGTGIRKQLGTISSWYKRSASRNLGVNRHGTTLRQRVQRYRYWLYFLSPFGIWSAHAQISLDEIALKHTMWKAH